MKNVILSFFTLLLSVFIWNACQNAAPATPVVKPAPVPAPVVEKPTAPADWLVSNEKGDLVLFGKPIKMAQLSELLQDSFSKMAKIPAEIPIKFSTENLMGFRGEINSTVSEAIAKAKIYHVLMSDKPEDMVKNFYAWYIDKKNTNESYQLLANKSDAESTLTNNLYKTLVKSQKKGVDSDYFIQAQDFGNDWGNVSILNSKVVGAANIFNIKLGGTSKDPKEMAAQNLEVTVMDTKPGWRIEKVAASK
jgi:hypothetical protein